MPDAIWFKLTERRKLAKGETGITTLNTDPVHAGRALRFILDEIAEFSDDGAVTMETRESTGDGVTSVIEIDWGKVPDSIRVPRIPFRRRP